VPFAAHSPQGANRSKIKTVRIVDSLKHIGYWLQADFTDTASIHQNSTDILVCARNISHYTSLTIPWLSLSIRSRVQATSHWNDWSLINRKGFNKKISCHKGLYPGTSLESLRKVTKELCEENIYSNKNKTNKQTPWPLVRERTIPTDRPPLVDEI
jgi:hypothetical protein